MTVTRDARGHKVGGVVCTLGTMTDWLSVPEFAARLGLRDSDVRELLRERHIVAMRRGSNNAVSLPADFIIDAEQGAIVVATLRGTITVLADSGLGDEAILEWLIAENDELGMSPLAALREGRRAQVRRIAQMVD